MVGSDGSDLFFKTNQRLQVEDITLFDGQGKGRIYRPNDSRLDGQEIFFPTTMPSGEDE